MGAHPGGEGARLPLVSILQRTNTTKQHCNQIRPPNIYDDSHLPFAACVCRNFIINWANMGFFCANTHMICSPHVHAFDKTTQRNMYVHNLDAGHRWNWVWVESRASWPFFLCVSESVLKVSFRRIARNTKKERWAQDAYLQPYSLCKY